MCMLNVFEMHSVDTLLALNTKEKRKLTALRKTSGRGFPFVFREKPFGRGRISANFAIVKGNEGQKASPKEDGHGLHKTTRERISSKRLRWSPKN